VSGIGKLLFYEISKAPGAAPVLAGGIADQGTSSCLCASRRWRNFALQHKELVKEISRENAITALLIQIKSYVTEVLKLVSFGA
jgi:hypothetical protein